MKINKSLDSTVSCLGIEGIYILYVALIALAMLAMVFIFMFNGIPLPVTIVITCTVTAASVYRVFKLSQSGNSVRKVRAKAKMNFYIIER